MGLVRINGLLGFADENFRGLANRICSVGNNGVKLDEKYLPSTGPCDMSV